MSIFVCYFLQINNKKFDKNPDKKDPFLLYENKYKKKYKELETIDLDEEYLKNLKNKIVIEKYTQR